MRCIFILSGENTKLGAAEVRVFARIASLDGRLLIADYNRNPSELNRLVYTKKIYKFLFSCSQQALLQKIKDFDWNAICKKSFSLRIFNNEKNALLSEKGLSSIIWDSLSNPKVDLENAETRIGILLSNKVYCGLLVSELKEDFEKRKPHLKPGFAPVSLNPRLARAMVNLSGAKKGEAICDPFCGVGGILVEAGLIGIKAIGYDIDKEMLGKCEKNLSFYKIKKYRLEKKNALELKKRYSYIVTDLPYGKSSAIKGNSLYENFIKNLGRILVKRAVIGLPDSGNFRELMSSEGLKIKEEFSCYIHKSLTKKIFVIEKNA